MIPEVSNECLVQVATALVSFVAGWLSRHLKGKKQ